MTRSPWLFLALAVLLGGLAYVGFTIAANIGIDLAWP
jgi:hypothetical protein